MAGFTSKGGERCSVQAKRSFDRHQRRIHDAAEAAARAAAETFLRRGRADIQKAGKFGSRWLDQLRCEVVVDGKGNVQITARHEVPYWTVFQYGRVIHGKPLLWIPLSFAKDAIGVRARDYPGRLFRVDRKDAGKAPLLLAVGKPAEPKYSGHASVTIPKKFHLVEIARDVSKEMGQLYKKQMRQSR